MVQLNFSIEWLAAEGIRDPALAQTWSQFSIRAGEQEITYCIDEFSRSARSWVFGSLLPLAEWLVRRWYDLLEGKREDLGEAASHRSWRRRHAWRSGREGMAFPDLVTFRRGDDIVFRWSADERLPPGVSVRFLSSGELVLPRLTAERSLFDLQQKLLFRLDSCMDARAVEFADEAARIKLADRSERRRRTILARLAIEEEDLAEIPGLQELVDDLASAEPNPLLDVLLDAADPGRLPNDAAWANEVWARCEQAPAFPTSLLRLREKLLRKAAPTGSPWQRGWQHARSLRDACPMLRPNGHAPAQGLRGWLEETLPGGKKPLPGVEDPALDDGIAWSARRMPAFLLAKTHREKAVNFRLARDLHGILYEGDPDKPFARIASIYLPSALSEANAFATELLAPADFLRERLAGNWRIEDEQVQSLSDELHVSTQVIRHQIENHHLGTLELG